MRNYHLDNSKAALMVLVIIGHLVEPLRLESATAQALYLFLYAFHMPAFAFVSGVLADDVYSRRLIQKTFLGLFVPFVVFDLLYEAAHFYLFSGEVSSYWQAGEPYWLMWYLLSLCVWRVALPFVLKFRFPGAVACGASVLASIFLEAETPLGLSRTFVFFPFYLFGRQYGEQVLSLVHARRVYRAVAVAALVVGAYVAFLWRGENVAWLYGSFSFAALGVAPMQGAVVRLALYLIGGLLIVAFLTIIPQARSVFGERAGNSLYVYLWHGIFVRLAEKVGLADTLRVLDPAIMLGLYSICALGLYLVLSSSVVRRFTDTVLLAPVQRMLERSLGRYE